MSNNPDTIKILDTRNDAITVPNVILETAGGTRIALPYTWSDLDHLDSINMANNNGRIQL